MPLPGGFYHGTQVRILRSPTKFALHLLGRRRQHRQGVFDGQLGVAIGMIGFCFSSSVMGTTSGTP